MRAHRALALFAKDPRAGAVKTRLVPPLTAAAAAALSRAFLVDTIAAMARTARRCNAQAAIFYDPPDAAAAFAALAPAGIDLHGQCAGDLGARLRHAYATLAAAGCTHVCFIGSDSPTLPHAYIERAFSALDAGADVAIGSADDGGYYALAARTDVARLVRGVTWSSERVFAQTMSNVDVHGLRCVTLPRWYDVDDAAGLARLRAEFAHDRSAGDEAPHTRNYLMTE
ncbi:MAG: TIGR04282 family arsenosugar biosynthesis glycosyltransferase [Candidatus Velthaea sp.]